MPSGSHNAQGMTTTEQAVWWLLRETQGELSARERLEFSAWCEDPTSLAALQEMRCIWRAFDDSDLSPHLRAIRKSALEVRAEAPVWWRGVMRIAAAAAASVSVAVGAGWLVWGTGLSGTWFGQEPGGQARLEGTAESGVYATGTGERLSVTLEDGTEVTLNTDTQIDVSYTAHRRLVHLVRGQVFFDVARATGRPFVVQADGRRVTALGTAFEVRLASRHFEVTLVEGEVLVENDEDRRRLAPDAIHELVLRPGERLVEPDGLAAEVSEIDVQKQLRWRTGFVEFHDERLVSAVAEMNRYTAHPIRIRDERLGEFRISGMFRTGQVESFMEIISEVLPISVERREGDSMELRLRDPTDDT